MKKRAEKGMMARQNKFWTVIEEKVQRAAEDEATEFLDTPLGKKQIELDAATYRRKLNRRPSPRTR